MEHNLEDALQSSMEVDFGHTEDVVVSQADITLDSSGHVESIPIEFDHMDTGSEEIIDFIGEQFILEDYQGDHQQSTIESNEQNILTSQSDTMIDIQFEPQTTAQKPDTQEVVQPTTITVKAAPSKQANKKGEQIALAPMPRQIAIAPKPPKLQQSQKIFHKYAIAPKPQPLDNVPPKPVALVANRTMVQKMSTANAVPTSGQRKTVLSLGNKQLLMLPTGSQKIKLVTTSGNVPVQYLRTDQNQLIPTKNVPGSPTKQLLTKFVVQKPSNLEGSNQPAVLTKIMPPGSVSAPTRFVTMHQKTVSIGNKVLMGSPTKQGVKVAKKHQIIAIKSPQKLVASQPQGTAMKKVVIKSNPSQNVILKTTAPPKTLQVTKDGNIVNTQGQKSQLHQINVPGKGIQYIRLITNSSNANPVLKPQPAAPAIPKTFVLTDDKGNLIQMTAEKINCASQPPPLVLTANTSAHGKVVAKPLQKLVRIAPVTKSMQLLPQPTIRSSQSLLAPLSPMEDTTFEDDVASLLNTHSDSTQDMPDIGNEEESQENEEASRSDHMDSKASIQALIAEAVADENIHQMDEVQVEFEREQNQDADEPSNIIEHGEIKSEHPLIVIPSNYNSNESFIADSFKNENVYREDEDRRNSLIDTDVIDQYESPQSPQTMSESDLVSTALSLRPRKACNCTKSQCLKLYCDCFANGEFCNNCNCNNCHNNLENEDLRQKAIRACLDRNPNAFRPKIGKSKTTGADLIRRHNKGCNCKRSGCLKNYCECFEAKIACTSICKCVGCRNVEETLERGRRRELVPPDPMYRHPPPTTLKQPCNFMTTEVIEAVCQCLVAAAAEGGGVATDPVRDVIDEFARCLQEIIGTAHQTPLDEA